MYDDRDYPWTNEQIKSLIERENAFYRRQTKSIDFDYTTLDPMTQKQSKIFARSAVSVSETKYYEQLAVKLNHAQSASKDYWSILKAFVNDTKKPVIPTLLGNNKLANDFSQLNISSQCCVSIPPKS